MNEATLNNMNSEELLAYLDQLRYQDKPVSANIVRYLYPLLEQQAAKVDELQQDKGILETEVEDLEIHIEGLETEMEDLKIQMDCREEKATIDTLEQRVADLILELKAKDKEVKTLTDKLDIQQNASWG